MTITKTSGKIKLKMNYAEYNSLCLWLDGSNAELKTNLEDEVDYMMTLAWLLMSDLYNRVMKKDNCPLRDKHVRLDKYSITLSISEGVILHYAVRWLCTRSYVQINLLTGLDKILR